MLKPVAAGLMCLGLTTLGVAVSPGEDSQKPESAEIEIIRTEGGTLVVESEVSVTEAKPADGKASSDGSRPGKYTELVEIEIGSDAGIAVDPLNLYRVQVEGKDIVISADDVKTIDKRHMGVGPRTARFALQASPGADVIDPETRGNLEKMIANLREEAKRLESGGKKHEAEQKMQSSQVVERLLKAYLLGMGRARVAHFTGPGMVSFTGGSSVPDEVKKLQVRRDELLQLLATKFDANDDAAAKLKHELVELEKVLADRQKAFEHQAVIVGKGKMTMAPAEMTARQPEAFGFKMTGRRSDTVARQAEVLARAAAQLKEAGLEERAKPLAEQAEQLKLQAQKMAKEEAELNRHYGIGGSGAGTFTIVHGEGSTELQRSIKELHEQVQLLRKEVSELRELLQLKR